MGQPAVVSGDRVRGMCARHQRPSPSGGPVPAGPLPFSAPLDKGLATTVTIEGRAAGVVGSNGRNQPAHAGLHASDPHMVAATQVGRVVRGSRSVFFDGKPAAYSSCGVTMCGKAPAAITGSASTVTVGS
jgi:hypothetical protein